MYHNSNLAIMKKILIILLSAISITAYSYDVEIDGIYYNEISFIGRKVAVTASPNDNKYSGDIIIPSEINIDGLVFNVVEIEQEAFINCTDLQTITIGSKVETIGASAFNNCSNLKTISIGPNVETISEDAFRGCIGLTVLSFEDSTNSLYIHPQTYKDEGGVGRGAFYDCPLDSVYFGRVIEFDLGVNGASAPFYNVLSLRSVKFGNCIETIKSSLLSWCPGVKNVDLGNNVKIIGGGAFTSIAAVEIILPESIDSIGPGAFYQCKYLKNVISLRKDPQPIHDTAFEYTGSKNYITNMTLYYPKGCREKYVKTEGWKKFRKFKDITPTELCLDVQDTIIYIGDSLKPKVSVSPYYAELSDAEWSSSDTSVAVVDSEGKITAVGQGNAIITVKINDTGISAEMKVEVLPILISSLSFSNSSISLSFSEQYQLQPIILPENSTNKELNWFSNNTNAVIVTNTGLVTRIGNGKCTIMAMTLDGSNLVATCDVEDPTDAITELKTSTNNSNYYSTNGTKHTQSIKGLNIIQDQNGKSIKILIK